MVFVISPLSDLANEPTIECIITHGIALNTAGYLVYECRKHVLVIPTDMSSDANSRHEEFSTKEAKKWELRSITHHVKKLSSAGPLLFLDLFDLFS
ncbi:hypothetical protein C5167_033067 [Papaver somniferum]|uniref:Uncharacterized protein n=1 Tax=Papaver somniferum TaxID=3469 RepID=A0A4Y7KCR3_PAPSO|nr:hypothetical protein C5167_033067 [Papaver somniferum]